MKILFVSESIWMTGVVYDLHMMAEGLSLLGHEVYAIDPGIQFQDHCHNASSNEFQKVSRVYPNANVHLLSPIIPKPPFRVFNLDCNRTIRRIYRYFKIGNEIKKILREVTIDIIMLYSAVRSGRQAVKIANKFKIPIVFRNVDMLHKLWPTAFDRKLAKIFEKMVYARVDKLLALTPKYAEYLINLGAHKSKVDLLLFPIDMEKFNPSIDNYEIRQSWGLSRDDKLIVFMGTLYEFGGVDEFTRQFPSVLKEIPQAKLLIVGDGPLRPALEKIITELKIVDRVIITGYQPFELMPQFINSATVCINVFPLNGTTRNLFSAKIIQYLSCQKATVSSSLPGIKTLIKEKSSGVLYADSIDGLNKIIIELIQSPEKREELAMSGRKYVNEFHRHDKIILRLEKILQSHVEVENAT